MQPVALRARQVVGSWQQYKQHHHTAKHTLKANDLQGSHGQVCHEEILKGQLGSLDGLCAGMVVCVCVERGEGKAEGCGTQQGVSGC